MKHVLSDITPVSNHPSHDTHWPDTFFAVHLQRFGPKPNCAKPKSIHATTTKCRNISSVGTYGRNKIHEPEPSPRDPPPRPTVPNNLRKDLIPVLESRNPKLLIAGIHKAKHLPTPNFLHQLHLFEAHLPQEMLPNGGDVLDALGADK